jgi:hypothetical protein
VTDDTIEQRATHPAPTDDSGYALRPEDFDFLSVPAHAAWACVDRVAPLGIPEVTFPYFIKELGEALKYQGFTDADVRLQGSSTRFYSGPHKSLPATKSARGQLFMEEHGRMWRQQEIDLIEETVASQWPERIPLRRPFDSLVSMKLSPDSSDIDVQISSDAAFELARTFARDRGIDPADLRFANPRYNFLVKVISDGEFLYLARWAEEWTKQLGRSVAVAIFDSAGPPQQDDGPSSHFRDEDWVIFRAGTLPQ